MSGSELFPPSPAARFIKMYLIRRGFQDGPYRAVLCGLTAFSVFTKYAKLWNLQRIESGGRELSPEQRRK